MTNVTTFPLTETFLAACDYAERGWHVFPVHGWIDEICTCGDPHCGNPAKHPTTKHGLKDATRDLERLSAIWRPGWNVAIRTGAESGLFVVDIDGAEGEVTLETLLAGRALPPTLETVTARGRHLFFQHPGRHVHTRKGGLGAKVDVRGDGGYVVAAPSQHASGAKYQWGEPCAVAAAPEWLIELVCGDARRAEDTSRRIGSWEPVKRYEEGDRWPVADVRDMLTHIPADLSYDEWVQVGMALHEGGYQLSLWDEWSRRGEKYRPGDCVKRWGGFNPRDGITMGTLVDQAKLYGWKLPEREPMRLEDHPARVFLERIRAARQAPTVAQKVEAASSGRLDVSAVEGLIGETAKWIVDSAIKPQPELALLNVLAALGAVYGRRYTSPLNTRTNLYLIGVAATGSGKDHSRRQLKTLMTAAGLDDLLGGDSVVSASGMVTLLQKTPSSLLMLDEFGMLMQAISDEKAGAHVKGIAKTLIELYSSSSSIYKSGQYADIKKEQVTLINPNLCIYGTTTTTEYTKALKKHAIESGELNRFIVLPTNEDYPEPRRSVASSAASERLIEAWKNLRPRPGNLAQLPGSMILPEPTMVLWGDCEERIFSILQYEHEEMKRAGQYAGLWHRYRENCIKVAMILAITRSPLTPVIRHDDLNFAELLLRLSLEFMRNLIGDYVADSQHEENCNEIVRVLKRTGEIRVGRLKRLLRRLDNKQFEAAARSLQDQDRLEITPLPGVGRSSQLYRLMESAQGE